MLETIQDEQKKLDAIAVYIQTVNEYRNMIQENTEKLPKDVQVLETLFSIALNEFEKSIKANLNLRSIEAIENEMG